MVRELTRRMRSGSSAKICLTILIRAPDSPAASTRQLRTAMLAPWFVRSGPLKRWSWARRAGSSWPAWA